MTIEEIMAGESKNIEFKVQRPKDSFSYMKTVVAFANGEGGKIIFGVEDGTLRVVGIPKEIVFTEMDAIASAIADNCVPLIIPDIYLQTVEEKTIIIVEIPSGKQRPYYVKSRGPERGTYIRIAGTSRPADRELSAEMYYEDEGRSYDRVVQRDRIVSDEEIQELCSQMKQVALKNASSEEQRVNVKDVTKEKLLNWELLSEDKDNTIHPTNGYTYLRGLDEFHSVIQCAVFKGKTRGIFVDKREYTGPLWEQVDDAYQFVLRNIHLGAKISGIYRQDVYELPPDSIRELIINAAMNCSFLQNSHIQVAVYDDRLEITSPGGLLPGVTFEKMRNGYSKIRNKALAQAFLYMNMIEEWGSGIPKLINEMQEYGLPEPEFIDMEIGFRVNLYRDQSKNEFGTNGTKVGTNGTKVGTNGTNDEKDHKLSNTLKTLIKENPKITQKEMSEAASVSLRTLKREIARMQEDGELERKGSSRTGKWVLK